mgnify:CR=1 FL=1
MMKKYRVPIAEIYVPVKRKQTLNPGNVETLAESILSNGLQTPIMVRPDGARYVLVEGLHRFRPLLQSPQHLAPNFMRPVVHLIQGDGPPQRLQRLWRPAQHGEGGAASAIVAACGTADGALE